MWKTRLRTISAGCAGAAVAAIPIAMCIAPVPASATTCATVAACLFGNNTRTVLGSGFGADSGVVGSAAAGDGVDGSTMFSSTASAAKSGVAGFDLSKTGTGNSGVFGFSGRGTGMHGTTNDGTGILGVATSSKGIGMHAEGSALALEANLLRGTGLVVADTSNIKYTNNTGIAVNVLGQGIVVGTDFGTALNVSGGPMGAGAVVTSYGGDGLDIDQGGPGIPLFINITGGGEGPEDYILVSGALALDVSGNLTISGSLTQNGTVASITRTTAGQAVQTYAPREAESTIEDVGEATVTNGRGAVPLDPSFASTIDPRKPYYVFLTAEGENRGLYVASKTARGFFIREANGGNSTLTVQYRIVAKPYDASAAPRLAAVNTAALPYANAYTAHHIEQLKQRAAQNSDVLTHVRKLSGLDQIPH